MLLHFSISINRPGHCVMNCKDCVQKLKKSKQNTHTNTSQLMANQKEKTENNFPNKKKIKIKCEMQNSQQSQSTACFVFFTWILGSNSWFCCSMSIANCDVFMFGWFCFDLDLLLVFVVSFFLLRLLCQHCSLRHWFSFFRCAPESPALKIN